MGFWSSGTNHTGHTVLELHRQEPFWQKAREPVRFHRNMCKTRLPTERPRSWCPVRPLIILSGCDEQAWEILQTCTDSCLILQLWPSLAKVSLWQSSTEYVSVGPWIEASSEFSEELPLLKKSPCWTIEDFSLCSLEGLLSYRLALFKNSLAWGIWETRILIT